MEKESVLFENYSAADNAVNPFTVDLKLKAVRIFTNSKLINPEDWVQDNEGIILNKDGEGMSSYNYKYSYYVDTGRSCRVFQSTYVRELAFVLDGNALRMLFYIITYVGKKMERVKINRKAYMEKADISLKTYYNTRDNLIKSGVIAPSKPNVFWINPNILFNGDRVEHFPDKVKVVANTEKK